MNNGYLPKKLLLVGILGVGFWGCSTSSGGGNGSGGTSSQGGTMSLTGGSASGGSGGAGTGGTTSSASAATGGVPGTGGTVASGGAKGSGGIQGTGGGPAPASGGVGSGGVQGTGGGPAPARGGAGSGGVGTGGGPAPARGGAGSGGVGTGGVIKDAGDSPDVAASGTACTVGPWPAADPAVAGPFATVTEENVGPVAGVAVDGGAPPQFTLFRPKDLAQGGLCHPVVTWGNGTGATPSMYKTLLGQLASHGFVVIASNSLNVGQGTPAPMVVGVTWVLAQNDDPTSVMYQRIDTARIGATGHSQGAFATTSAGADTHITTIAPICGASTQRNLHGPALLLCGGNDTSVPCSTVQTAFNGITNQPVMLADYLSADHANWISFRAGTLSAIEVAVVAWMRVQLMGDTALRPRFYGASCTLCTDTAWQITQKMMDQ